MQKEKGPNTHKRFASIKVSRFLLFVINKKRKRKLPPSLVQGKTTPRKVHDHDSGSNRQQQNPSPRERTISKEHANTARLRSHVTGAIVHSGLSSQAK